MKTMTFIELWENIEELKVLPSTAIVQIPDILSESTKKKLSQLTPQKAACVVRASIEEINRGSIKPIDSLIREKL